MKPSWILGIIVATVLPLGCGPIRTPLATGYDVPQDQWSRGVWLYGQHCASCHGEGGEGDADAPKIMGTGALPRVSEWKDSSRTSELGNALDLFEYVKSETLRAVRNGYGRSGRLAHIYYMIVGAAGLPFVLGSEFELLTKWSAFESEMIEAHVDSILDLFYPSASRDSD